MSDAERNQDADYVCKNCGDRLHWSLDFRCWIHDQPRVTYCIKNFDSHHNPTTKAELIDGTGAAE